MIYGLYLITTIYAFLCITESMLKVRQWKSSPAILSMLVGGICLLTALILKSNVGHKIWVLALMALVCISLCGWKNESEKEKILFHHIMRAIISLIILAGFIVL